MSVEKIGNFADPEKNEKMSPRKKLATILGAGAIAASMASEVLADETKNEVKDGLENTYQMSPEELAATEAELARDIKMAEEVGQAIETLTSVAKEAIDQNNERDESSAKALEEFTAIQKTRKSPINQNIDLLTEKAKNFVNINTIISRMLQGDVRSDDLETLRELQKGIDKLELVPMK